MLVKVDVLDADSVIQIELLIPVRIERLLDDLRGLGLLPVHHGHSERIGEPWSSKD
jgi:hypothetical protein